MVVHEIIARTSAAEYISEMDETFRTLTESDPIFGTLMLWCYATYGGEATEDHLRSQHGWSDERLLAARIEAFR